MLLLAQGPLFQDRWNSLLMTLALSPCILFPGLGVVSFLQI